MSRVILMSLKETVNVFQSCLRGVGKSNLISEIQRSKMTRKDQCTLYYRNAYLAMSPNFVDCDYRTS